MRLTAALFLLMTVCALAAEQAPPKSVESCKAEVPFGMPSVHKDHVVVCRTGYVLSHDPEAKIPAWVAWTLVQKDSLSCLPRNDAFATDQSLPEGKRATPQDYAGSGYDQGHLAPNAEMSYDPQVARESFIMSNMSPQLPQVNRGTWKTLESTERSFVYNTGHPVTIYAGNIYTKESKTIGKNKVVVPDQLFKIIVDNTDKVSYAFIFPNVVNIDQDFNKYQVTVADVEKATATIFPTPDDKSTKKSLPTVDLNKIVLDKKAKCK
jgi:endonuclease G